MKKSSMKKKKKIYPIVIFLIVVLLLLVLIGTIMLFVNNSKYKAYEKYEEFMNTYDFAKLYNNGTAKSSEYVSEIEAIKIIIAAAYNNTTNVFSLQEEFTTNEIWYEHAKDLKLVNESSEKNYNKKVTLIEVIKYISDSKNNILNLDIDSSTKPTFSDYNNYTKSQRYSITDLVSAGIIANSTEKLDGNRKIRKGELNELISNFVNKYTLLTSDESLTEDTEKLPSNSSDYPYILENVEKEVYEQPFLKEIESDFISPKDFYKVEKSNYDEIAKTCESYYNALLNIDYSTITKDSFVSSIDKYIIGNVNQEKVQKYVDYVISNHIVISGVATAQMPIIYNDGMDLRIRMKLEFAVESSDTNENLIYLDDYYNQKVEYKDKNSVYIDAKLGYTLSSDKVYNYQRPIYTMLLEKYADYFEVKGE